MTTTQTKSPLHWTNRYAKQISFDGIQMTLIGGWSDLAACYAGSDGNAWTVQGSSWSNNGPQEQFRDRFAKGFYRGELIKSRCPGCGCQEVILPEHVVCRDCESIPRDEPQPDYIKYAENPPL